VILAACARQPSAEIELAEPEAKAEQQHDARIEAVCVHSFTVLLHESPSLSSPGIERDFIAHCIAGNQLERSELGEQRWAERAACIERAQTSDELGLCDGRSPRTEPNPPVAAVGTDSLTLCKRVFDLLLAEQPDMAQVFPPERIQPLLENCVAAVEVERANDPVAFDRRAQCMMAATSSADIEQCWL
jgi:hypothetical protein